MTAGNLATSQAVYHRIQKDLDSTSPKINLNLCQDLEEVAEYIGEISLECQKIGNDIPLQESAQLGSSFILGGQIKNQSPNIILIYPEVETISMFLKTVLLSKLEKLNTVNQY